MLITKHRACTAAWFILIEARIGCRTYPLVHIYLPNCLFAVFPNAAMLTLAILQHSTKEKAVIYLQPGLMLMSQDNCFSLGPPLHAFYID